MRKQRKRTTKTFNYAKAILTQNALLDEIPYKIKTSAKHGENYKFEGNQIKNEPGLRFDADKPRFDLIPPEIMFELARVYQLGAVKYADRNWEKGMSWGRCFRAMMSHAWKWWMGEQQDKELSCHHLAMVAWNAFALYTYETRSLGTDDRATGMKWPQWMSK